MLHEINPTLRIIPRDIYNHNDMIRRELRQGNSSIEALVQYLLNKGIYHRARLDKENRVNSIFVICPESLKYLQSHHDVVLIDNTYRTNIFNLPLMVIIG